jgi:hypothetical protein
MPSTVSVLNRLLLLHEYSLPMYLGYAAPWTIGHDEAAKEVLMLIVADQKQLAERIGRAILDAGGVVSHGHFPLHFTGYHDLSFDFLVKRMIVAQKKDLAAIETCIAQLEGVPNAKALAEEALGAAKGHLESLEELAQAQAQAAGA